jgi:hypothetical protein
MKNNFWFYFFNGWKHVNEINRFYREINIWIVLYYFKKKIVRCRIKSILFFLLNVSCEFFWGNSSIIGTFSTIKIGLNLIVVDIKDIIWTKISKEFKNNQMNFDQENFQEKKGWFHSWLEIDNNENERLENLLICYFIEMCTRTILWAHNNAINFAKVNNEA